MRLPEKSRRTRPDLAARSGLTRADVDALIAISCAEGVEPPSRDPQTGHVFGGRPPRVKTLSEVLESTGVTVRHWRDLKKRNLVEDRGFGPSTTPGAFVAVWFFFGADPLEQKNEKASKRD